MERNNVRGWREETVHCDRIIKPCLRSGLQMEEESVDYQIRP